jgi:DNA-binding MarR family transcriptional regulator
MTDDAPQKRTPQKNLELTTAQKNALRVYLDWEEKHAAPPNGAELASALGITRQQAHQYINILHDKGYLAPRRVTLVRLRVTAKGKKAL